MCRMEDVKPVVGVKRPLVEEYDSEEEDLQKPKVKRKNYYLVHFTLFEISMQKQGRILR